MKSLMEFKAKLLATYTTPEKESLDDFVARMQKRIDVANEVRQLIDPTQRSEVNTLIQDSTQKIKSRKFSAKFTQTQFKKTLDQSTRKLAEKIETIASTMLKRFDAMLLELSK